MGHELSGATARASLQYDIENDSIVEAKLEPLPVDERSLAKEHLEALTDLGLGCGKRKPIGIFDRGYPSKELITYLQDKGITDVMRVQPGFNPRIDKMQTGERPVTLSEGTSIRALVFRLTNGEQEAWITNLEEGEREAAVFSELYYQRWPNELYVFCVSGRGAAK